MYNIHNMRISVMPDELGLYPVVHQRVTPAWMSAEHYENCETNLMCRIRDYFKQRQNG